MTLGYGDRDYGNSGLLEIVENDDDIDDYDYYASDGNVEVPYDVDTDGDDYYYYYTSDNIGLIYFEITSNATLSCAQNSLRCQFDRSHFDAVDDQGGIIMDQKSGSTWSVENSETDALHLSLCLLKGGCLVSCFQGCECKNPYGSACLTTTAPPSPPTPSVTIPTSPPGSVPCAMSKNTDQCRVVAIKDNLRPGEQCDHCYNFCNGKFLGCCDESGMCGAGTCDADPVTGLLEEVYGCQEIFDSPPMPSQIEVDISAPVCVSNIFGGLRCDMKTQVRGPQGNVTDVSIGVECKDASGDADLRSASNCECMAVLENTDDMTKNDCSCSVCPSGYGSNPVIIDCPAEILAGECSSIDCDGACNGSCLSDCTLSGPECGLPCTEASVTLPPNSTLQDQNSTSTLIPTLSPTISSSNSTLSGANETLEPTFSPSMASNFTFDDKRETSPPTLDPTTVASNWSSPEDSNESVAPTLAPTRIFNTSLDLNETMAPTTGPSQTPNVLIPESITTLAPTSPPSIMPNSTSPTSNMTSTPTPDPTIAPNGTVSGNETIVPMPEPTQEPTLSPNMTVPTGNETNVPTIAPNITDNSTHAPTWPMPNVTWNETTTPTLQPSLAPNITLNETSFPTYVPTIAPNGTTPDANQTMLPTSSPTVEQIKNATDTMVPTSSPTVSPTSHNVSIPETTFRPTATATVAPTSTLTEAPTEMPTTEPSPGATTSPTLNPAREYQTHEFNDVSMRLTQVGKLSPEAKAAFEVALENLYKKAYQTAERRRLQVQGISNFETDVSVTDEKVDRFGNTVIYDQVLRFNVNKGTVDDAQAESVLLAPVSSEEGKLELLEDLKSSNEQFAEATEVGTPSVPQNTRTSDIEDDSNSNTGLSRLAFVFIIVASVVFCCCFWASIGLVALTGRDGRGRGRKQLNKQPGDLDEENGEPTGRFDAPPGIVTNFENDFFEDERNDAGLALGDNDGDFGYGNSEAPAAIRSAGDEYGYDSRRKVDVGFELKERSSDDGSDFDDDGDSGSDNSGSSLGSSGSEGFGSVSGSESGSDSGYEGEESKRRQPDADMHSWGLEQ